MPKGKTNLKYSDDEMKRHVGAIKEHFDEKMEVVKEGFKLVNQTLNSHTEMIGKIMLQLEEIRGEMRQKVDYTDFAKLEKRVVYLETRLARA